MILTMLVLLKKKIYVAKLTKIFLLSNLGTADDVTNLHCYENLD